MALQLQLTVRFLTDRYHGNDWPPSPARLFQALVAGTKTGAARREFGLPHKGALEWLERLDPPEILARPRHKGKEYTLFVQQQLGQRAEEHQDVKSRTPTQTRGSRSGKTGCCVPVEASRGARYA